MGLKKNNTEKITRLSELIIRFNQDKELLTSEDIKDIRAEVSVILYELTEGLLQDYYHDYNVAAVNYESAKAAAFSKAFENNGSTAANILYKEDKDYLKRFYEKDEAKGKLDVLKQLIEQGNQVLHSMASLSRD